MSSNPKATHWGHIGLTNLNQDITAIILGLVESKRDLSSLMKTCQTMRSSAEPHLLADVAVGTYDHGKSFCTFMLAEGRRDQRLRSLRQLSFYLQPGITKKRKARLIHDLINVLRGARFLRLFSTNESVLTGLMLRIQETAKAISHIQELELHTGKGQEVEILMEAEVPLSLQKLAIKFQCIGSFDFLSMISSVRGTLEVLSVASAWGSLGERMDLEYPSLRAPIWPV